MITDLTFYAAALPAVTLLGLAKGGFAGIGLLALPLLTLTISPLQAAAITLPILLVQDVVSVWAYRHTWDSRNLAILLPSATFGIVLGYVLAAQVSDAAVTLAVGAVSAARDGACRREEPPAGRHDSKGNLDSGARSAGPAWRISWSACGRSRHPTSVGDSRQARTSSVLSREHRRRA